MNDHKGLDIEPIKFAHRGCTWCRTLEPDQLATEGCSVARLLAVVTRVEELRNRYHSLQDDKIEACGVVANLDAALRGSS